MTIAETIFEQVRTLPEADAREILDFVEFLKAKRKRDHEERQAHALAVLEKFKGRYDGTKFNRDELHERAGLR
jgi:hypothetical protein